MRFDANRLRITVRMKVFPERDGNFRSGLHVCHNLLFVRMKVFPERDGNSCLSQSAFPARSLAVRMKVFPERDGNFNVFVSASIAFAVCPNEGLP